MMTTFAVSDTPPVDDPEFRPSHPWDAWFFPLSLAFYWVGLVMGFGGDMVYKAKLGQLSFPLIVHIHAAVYVGWMVLLTTQVALIRKGRSDLHRKLGVTSLGFVPVMLLVGPMAAFTTQTARFGTPASDPAFLAIQLGGLVSFAILITAALLSRKDAALHKRLVLLSTLTLVDAGFARWVGPIWGPVLGPALGSPFWTNYLTLYGCTAALMLSIGVYDLLTRRRLLTGYVLGLILALCGHFTIVAAYMTPAWAAFCKGLIGGLAGH